MNALLRWLVKYCYSGTVLVISPDCAAVWFGPDGEVEVTMPEHEDSDLATLPAIRAAMSAAMFSDSPGGAIARDAVMKQMRAAASMPDENMQQVATDLKAVADEQL